MIHSKSGVIFYQKLLGQLWNHLVNKNLSLWTHFVIKCTDKKKKMADKRRTVLSLQENEELAETIRTFPCLYDKSKKEYKDRNVFIMFLNAITIE